MKQFFAKKRWPKTVDYRELSGDPNPQYFLKNTAIQMGGVLPYKWEIYFSLSSRLRSQEGTAIQMGGVLPYKWEVYCWVSLSSRLRSQEGTAIQMGGRTAVQIGGVLQHFLREQ